MVKVACSHCILKAANRTYLYVDNRGVHKTYPLLSSLPTIPVHLCDDCDKLFNDQTRIDVVYEVLVRRLKPSAPQELDGSTPQT